MIPLRLRESLPTGQIISLFSFQVTFLLGELRDRSKGLTQVRAFSHKDFHPGQVYWVAYSAPLLLYD